MKNKYENISGSLVLRPDVEEFQNSFELHERHRTYYLYFKHPVLENVLIKLKQLVSFRVNPVRAKTVKHEEQI